MKKLLKLIGANVVILTSSQGLLACTPPSLGEIWIITDGGDINDHAFNQQVLEGSQQFAKTFNDNSSVISKFSGFDYWKDHSMRVKTIISKDGQLSTLQTNYMIAGYAGAKTIVCSGFGHIAALTPQIQSLYKSLGVRFILVDALLNQPTDVAGLTYASDQSGFLAGLAGAIWLVANHESYDANGLKMSTFGGLPADTVVSYMFGYYWGIQYFNEFKSDPEILQMVNDIRTKNSKLPMTASDLQNKSVNFDKLTDSFTGSFSSGTASAQTVTSTLINKQKDAIVLPVAGAQTTDLIASIHHSSNNSQAKVIGVDVDQSVQYESSKNLFVTSALKGIKKSVNWMLWYSLDLQQDQTSGTINPDPDGEQYFNGIKHYSPLTGSDYTGIAKNPAVAPIYDKLMNQSKYWDLAQKVSDAFKILSEDTNKQSSADKWEKAWQSDVNKDDPTKNKYDPDFGP